MVSISKSKHSSPSNVLQALCNLDPVISWTKPLSTLLFYSLSTLLFTPVQAHWLPSVLRIHELHFCLRANAKNCFFHLMCPFTSFLDSLLTPHQVLPRHPFNQCTYLLAYLSCLPALFFSTTLIHHLLILYNNKLLILFNVFLSLQNVKSISAWTFVHLVHYYNLCT